MPIIPVLWLQRKEDCEFEASPNPIAGVYSKKKNRNCKI